MESYCLVILPYSGSCLSSESLKTICEDMTMHVPCKCKNLVLESPRLFLEKMEMVFMYGWKMRHRKGCHLVVLW